MPRALLPLLALSVACITPKSNNGGDDGTGDGTSVTISDIRQGNVEEDSIVTLTDVVVTSGVTLEGSGFYVQDAGGGAYSGIYVFLQGTFDELYLEVGDKVTITGTYTEFYGFSELTVGGMDDITVTGTSDVTVTPVTDTSDWEQWESVLVSLADQTMAACPDQYGETPITAGIEMNDQLYDYSGDRNATISELIGLIEYSFDEWKINPRSDDDLVGFVAGDGCSFTIPDIHDMAGSYDDEDIYSLGAVELVGVVATSEAITGDNQGFFIQEEGGGEKSGVFVYLGDEVDVGALGITPGDVMDISGSATVFFGFTEVSVYNNSDISKTGTATPVADVLTATPADWEVWEGALVTLDSPTATGNIDGYGQCPTDYDIVLHDWFYEYEASNGMTWDSITGLVTFAYDTRGLQPRNADDMVGGKGGGGGGTDASVADIQNGTIAEGTTVTLTGVIATTSSDMANEDGFFVQDPGGGEYSGIYIFTSADVDIAVGDELTITGTVDEFYDFTELSVGSSADIEKTGTGTVTIDDLASTPSDWEAWEGGLIRLTSGLEIDDCSGGYGACTTSWSGLYIDDLAYNYDDSYGEGDSFSAVTGVLTWSFDEWRINPRAASDLVE